MPTITTPPSSGNRSNKSTTGSRSCTTSPMPPNKDGIGQQHRSGNFLKNLFSLNGSRSSLNSEKNAAVPTSDLFRRRSKSQAPNRRFSGSGTIQIRTVEIMKRPGQNLGFYLRDGNGLDRMKGIFVSRIADSSPLARNNLIKAGDEILAVNSIPTSSMKMDDCVYVISLSSKLLITVRSVPFDTNRIKTQAQQKSIVVNHVLKNKAEEMEKSKINGNVEEDKTSPPGESSGSLLMIKSDSKEAANEQSSKSADSDPVANQKSISGEETGPSNEKPSRDSDSALSSSDENLFQTTLEKMESQFATLPSGKKPQPPPTPTDVAPMAPPAFFDKKPQKYKSVEEFVMQSSLYSKEDCETEPAVSGDGKSKISLQTSSCTCEHRVSSQPHCHPHDNGVVKGRLRHQLPYYRGLVRPLDGNPATLSLSDLNNPESGMTSNGKKPTVGSNCYNCIRFGAYNCPNHRILVHNRYYNTMTQSQNGYLSDGGEDCGYSRPRRNTYNNAAYMDDGFRHHPPPPPRTGGLLYRSPGPQAIYSSNGSIADQQCFIRRPNYLEMKSGTLHSRPKPSVHYYSDTEQGDSEDVEGYEPTRLNRRANNANPNQRLQLLMMQQNMIEKSSRNVRNTSDQQSSVPSFTDHKKVTTYDQINQEQCLTTPAVNGQLSLNLQGFYDWNCIGEAENKSNVKPANSALASLFCSVYIDGKPIGKTAARIGLKSFYFNEVFSANLNSNRYLTLVIYHHIGSGKAPQRRSACTCLLSELCCKENTSKVALQMYPHGVLYMRWIMKPTASSKTVSLNRQIFGVDLKDLVDSEIKIGLLSCHVPVIVQLSLRILNTCTESEGLYSRETSKEDRKLLKETFEHVWEPKQLKLLCDKLKNTNVHVISDVLLDFFNELPTPLYSENVAEQLIAYLKSSIEQPHFERQTVVRQILFECSPKHVAETFQCFLDHLYLLYVNTSTNKLTLVQLEELFSSVLFATPEQESSTKTPTDTNQHVTMARSTPSNVFNQINQIPTESPDNHNSNEQSSSILLSPSTTASASSVVSATMSGVGTTTNSSFSISPNSSKSDSCRATPSLFIQLCEILFHFSHDSTLVNINEPSERP